MNFRDQQAIYLQIADYVCENILLKKWPAGEKLISIRDLAVEITGKSQYSSACL
jgi:DNA-binding transcriptional regulator YhcF (GntR family)